MSPRTTRLLARRIPLAPSMASDASVVPPDATTATDPIQGAVWACRHCGVEIDAVCEPLTGRCVDHELVSYRLEQAGATLLAMRGASPGPAGHGSSWPEVVHEAILAYGWAAEPTRPALPDARAIGAMDAAYAWLGLVPWPMIRRVVAARSLVHPVSQRHLLSWRRLGHTLGCSHEALRGWHAKGIDRIVTSLQNR